MPTGPERRRVKRSMYLDADVLEWLQRRGEARERSVDYQVREILREAMNAEYVARRDDVDTEQT